MKTWIMNLPIKKKFMISYVLIIVIISVSAGVISTLLTTSRLQKETLNMASQLTQQVSENIQYRAGEIETLAYQIITDSVIRGVLSDNTVPRSTASRTNDAVLLTRNISQYLMRYSCIESVTLYMENGNTMYWEKGNPNSSTTQTPLNADNQQAIQKAEETSGDIAWLRIENDRVLLAKKAVDIETLDRLGYIVLCVDADFFNLEYDQGESLIEPANIIVLDKSGSIIIGNGLNDMDGATAVGLAQKAQNRNEIIRFGGEYYMLTRYSGKWTTMCFIPMRGIRASVAAFWLWSLGTCVALGALAMILAGRISSSVTRNIQALSAGMRQVETGDFSIRTHIESRDEVGLLAEQFNHMVQRIGDLIHSVSEERLKRQAMEYQVLQAQINPHFLYNTLGSIRCLAQLNNDNKVEIMLTAMINLLKETLSSQGSTCTLQAELTCVENYFVLQQIRYNNRFQFTFDIQDGTEACRMLSFTVQPLVENALYHGLLMEEGRNRINISSRIQGKLLVLEVQDDGIGMDEQTIRQVLQGPTGKSSRLTGIGISNINERIRYYFGESYGVSIQSNLGHGTVVRLELPCIFEDDPS